MDSNPWLYEERHGWNLSAVLTVSIGGLVGLASLVGFSTLHLVRLLVVGLILVLGAALRVVSSIAHRFVLRVDEHGITLTKPSSRAQGGEVIAWPQVRSIVLSKAVGGTALGIVKLNAGIPVSALTSGGSPKPDLTIPIASSRFDSERFIEAVHAYASEVPITDERPARDVGRTRFARRPAFLAGAGAIVLVGSLLGVSAFHSSSTSGYTVQAGSTGTPAVLTLPQEIGQLTFIGDDGSYLFHYQPALLPNGPSSSYGTIGGSYASTDPSTPDIDVDGIYAGNGVGHHDVFSLSPQALADLAASTLFAQDAQHYPSGRSDAVLECGTYGDAPQCVWADQSDLVFVTYGGVPGSLDGLAALAPSFAAAVEGRS